MSVIFTPKICRFLADISICNRVERINLKEKKTNPMTMIRGRLRPKTSKNVKI